MSATYFNLFFYSISSLINCILLSSECYFFNSTFVSIKSGVHVLYYEPCCEKTGLRGFRPGPTQTGLYSHKRWLEASNFLFRKKRGCTIYVAKTKALISFVVTAKLICVFVFAYLKSRFSHDEAFMMMGTLFMMNKQ